MKATPCGPGFGQTQEGTAPRSSSSSTVARWFASAAAPRPEVDRCRSSRAWRTGQTPASPQSASRRPCAMTSSRGWWNGRQAETLSIPDQHSTGRMGPMPFKHLLAVVAVCLAAWPSLTTSGTAPTAAGCLAYSLAGSGSPAVVLQSGLGDGKDVLGTGVCPDRPDHHRHRIRPARLRRQRGIFGTA